MNNVWIKDITKNMNNNIINDIIIYIDEEEFETDRNMFPSGCEILNNYNNYEDFILTNNNEFKEKFYNKNGIYCLEDFDVYPRPNFFILKMSKNEFSDKLEDYFNKNFRIYYQKIIINDFN